MNLPHNYFKLVKKKNSHPGLLRLPVRRHTVRGVCGPRGVSEKGKRLGAHKATFRAQIIYKKACEMALSRRINNIWIEVGTFQVFQQAARDLPPALLIPSPSPNSPPHPPRMIDSRAMQHDSPFLCFLRLFFLLPSPPWGKKQVKGSERRVDYLFNHKLQKERFLSRAWGLKCPSRAHP